MNLIKVRDVYGDTCHIDLEEYQQKVVKGRKLLKVYHSTGRLRTIRQRGKRDTEPLLLHVDNIREEDRKAMTLKMLPAQIESCANCGAAINRRTDGYGSDPAKGLLCTGCWRKAHGQAPLAESPDLRDLGFTPGPWTVAARNDDYGSYWIQEAATEQQGWVDDGYEISDAEGERRNAIAEMHDEGNRQLIQATLHMLDALEEIKRNCEPWKTADNMAGRLFAIADYAIRKAKEKDSV